MQRLVIAVVLGAFFVTAACAKNAQSTEAPSITAAELNTRRESAAAAPTILDVRTPEEYASGHIPGAVNIPFDEVARRVGEIDASRGVAVYCQAGPRARKGESALRAAGHDTLFHLEGGFTAWQAAGLPVERPR